MTKQHDGIVSPNEHDVLSGRGNFVNYHAGNEHFRALVRKHKVAYVACPKPQKGKFSKLIYDEIRSRNPPGRFLKQDSKTKLWYDIGEKKALDKTRQGKIGAVKRDKKRLCLFLHEPLTKLSLETKLSEKGLQKYKKNWAETKIMTMKMRSIMTRRHLNPLCSSNMVFYSRM
jgi:hypothetical protein